MPASVHPLVKCMKIIQKDELLRQHYTNSAVSDVIKDYGRIWVETCQVRKMDMNSCIFIYTVIQRG